VPRFQIIERKNQSANKYKRQKAKIIRITMMACRSAASKFARQVVSGPSVMIYFRSLSANDEAITATCSSFSSKLRSFSSSAPSLVLVEKGLEPEMGDKEQAQAMIDVRASLPVEHTSGHVLEVLNRKGAGGKPLNDDDMTILFDAAKTPKDARVIMTALVNYKRINNYILTTKMAEMAVKSILQADPEQGAFLVLSNFNEKSGLYFSCEIPLINFVLDVVLNQIDYYEKDSLWLALISMQNSLIYRAHRPYQKMKKRAARKYHKQIQLHHGPTAETVRRMVDIALKIRAAEVVHSEITTHCQDRRVPVLEETLRLVEEARFQERMDALAQEAETND
jgi:hypothetical protein